MRAAQSDYFEEVLQGPAIVSEAADSGTTISVKSRPR